MIDDWWSKFEARSAAIFSLVRLPLFEPFEPFLFDPAERTTCLRSRTGIRASNPEPWTPANRQQTNTSSGSKHDAIAWSPGRWISSFTEWTSTVQRERTPPAQVATASIFSLRSTRSICIKRLFTSHLPGNSNKSGKYRFCRILQLCQRLEKLCIYSCTESSEYTIWGLQQLPTAILSFFYDEKFYSKHNDALH